jgi:hypothetical protein
MTGMPEISVLPSEAPVAAAPGSSPGVPLGRDLIRLRAAFGQDEANHGTARYSVDNDGLIQVPPEAVGPLTTTGGFVFTKTGDDAISVGSLKLHHDDAAGCSYAGRQYLGDANGDVLVPAEATSELLAHGFVPIFDEAIAASNRVKLPPSDRSKKG